MGRHPLRGAAAIAGLGITPQGKVYGTNAVGFAVDAVRLALDDAGLERDQLYQGRDLEGEKAKGRPMGGSAWNVEGLDLVPRGVIDEKLEPLLDVVEGRTSVWIHCADAMDVDAAIEIARENGFLERTTLVLRAPCWKAAESIAAAGVPVVLGTELLHIERDPVSGEEIETFVPRVMRDAGVRFALQSDSSSSLWYQAATCLGYGFTREEALAAATRVPAEMLGLEDRVGALAPGGDGNVVLLSGDPLSVTSHVEYVVLAGELVYDRSADVRNKHLLEGVVPENTQAGGETDGGVHVHGDDEDPNDDRGDGGDDGDDDEDGQEDEDE